MWYLPPTSPHPPACPPPPPASPPTPQEAWLTWRFPNASSAVFLDVVFVGKGATRLPEASWLRFRPGLGAVDVGSWRMHKMGSLVGPREVRGVRG